MDTELREMVARGGESGTQALQLATLKVLEALAGRPKADEDEHTLDDLFSAAAAPGADSEDSLGLAGAKGSASLVSLNRSIKRHPARWNAHLDAAMARALGSDVDHGIWSAREYGDRRIHWGNQESLQRVWTMLAALHALHRRGETDALGAKIGQCLKATELAARCGGDWQMAWPLTDLPDPRPKAGSVKESLAHPAELAAAAAFLKEQTALDTVMGRTSGDGGRASSDGGKKAWWADRDKKKRESEGGGGSAGSAAASSRS